MNGRSSGSVPGLSVPGLSMDGVRAPSPSCRIREVNLEFGYAVIEPGVTQADFEYSILNSLNRCCLTP